jgi:hypothetical protein
MPETTMDEDGLSAPRQNDIRFPRQIFAVKPESVSKTMEEPTNHKFGRRVL